MSTPDCSAFTLPLPVRWAGMCTVVAIAAFVFPGCVSPKYRLMPATDNPTPIPLLSLKAEGPSTLHATVDSVIVYHGPGSWKREAYWDEYLVTLANRGASPVRVEAAILSDFQNQPLVAGGDPWILERASKTWWENARYGDTGRLLALGGGATAAGVVGVGIANAATLTGAPAAFAAATTVAAAALPVYAVATVVRNVKTRHQVEAEFQRRRLALPLTLASGQVITGSVFFRISPGPQRLALRVNDDSGPRDVVIDLGSMAGLHQQSARPAPRQDLPAATASPRHFGYSAAPVFSLQ